jgi:hypothetical protein
MGYQWDGHSDIGLTGEEIWQAGCGGARAVDLGSLWAEPRRGGRPGAVQPSDS